MLTLWRDPRWTNRRAPWEQRARGAPSQPKLGSALQDGRRGEQRTLAAWMENGNGRETDDPKATSAQPDFTCDCEPMDDVTTCNLAGLALHRAGLGMWLSIGDEEPPYRFSLDYL